MPRAKTPKTSEPVCPIFTDEGDRLRGNLPDARIGLLFSRLTRDKNGHIEGQIEAFYDGGLISPAAYLRLTNNQAMRSLVSDYAQRNGTPLWVWKSFVALTVTEATSFVERQEARRAPEPLGRPRTKAGAYPVEALGEVLGEAALAMFTLEKAPLSVCCQGVLGGAALSVQAHANAWMDGRRYPLSLYEISIAESGWRKTRVDELALAAHREYEETLEDNYVREKYHYDNLREARDKQRKRILDDKKLAAAEQTAALDALGLPPIPPLGAMLILTDTTYEGIVRVLADCQPSIVLNDDDAAQFFGSYSMHDKNQMATLGGLNKLWNASPIARARSSTGAGSLRGRRLSLHLMMQEHVAEQILTNANVTGLGFLSRALTVWPETLVGTRTYSRGKDIQKDAAYLRYKSRMNEILSRPPDTKPGDPGQLMPRALHLEGEAKEAAIDFYDHTELLTAPGERYAPIFGFASKALEHAVRLAGIMQLVEDFNAPTISLAHMRHGITLTEFYLTEALRLTDKVGVHPDMVLATKLWEWLKDKTLIHPVMVYHSGPGSIRNKQTAQRILALLQDHHRIERLPPQRIDGVFRKDVWKVVHRGEQEEQSPDD